MRIKPDSRFIAHLILATALLQVPGMQPVPVASVVAVLGGWWILRDKRRERDLRFWGILGAGVLLLGSGAVLASWHGAAEGPLASTLEQALVYLWAAGSLIAVLAVYWAMKFVDANRGFMLLSIGGLVTGLLLAGHYANPWKFSLAFPATLAGLAAFSYLRRGGIVLVAGISMVVSALLDSRGPILFALIVIGATLLSPGMRRRVGAHPAAALLAASLSMVIVVIAFVGAMSAGLFGSEIARRTSFHVSTISGAVLGTRPEVGVTWGLAKAQPWGYGAGASVTPSLIPNFANLGGNAYLHQNVFGARVDLHSITANLWFHFGLVGLALALAALVTIARGSLRTIAGGWEMPAAPMLYLLVVGGWHLMFSPTANSPVAATAVGVALYVTVKGKWSGGSNLIPWHSLPRSARTRALRFEGIEDDANLAASIGLMWRALTLEVRGVFYSLFTGPSTGHLVVGKRTLLSGLRYVRHTGRLVIEDGAELQGLSRRGLLFGDGVSIGAGARIRPTSYYGGEVGEGLQVGDRSSIASACFIGCSGFISIGSDVILGPNVSVYSENHVFDRVDVTIKSQGVKRTFVTIEDDCWIGSGAVILPGVTIGRGAVVAAKSVVTEDVPPYAVVAGTPAVVTKMRQ